MKSIYFSWVDYVAEKIQLGKLESDLVEKLDKYANLTGKTRIGVLRHLIETFLEDKVLTNDFLDLDKDYYFDYDKLIKNGSVECTTNKPTTNLKNHMIVKRIPNNLDEWKGSTYAHGSTFVSSNHKGIRFNSLIFLDEDQEIEEIEPNYLVFNLYNHNPKDLVDKFKEPKLVIDLIKSSELRYYLDLSSDKEIISNLETLTLRFNRDRKNLLEFHSSNDIDGKVPKNLLTEYYKLIFSFTLWHYFNSKLFLPVITYSKLMNFKLLFEVASDDELKQLEDIFNISKQHLFSYSERFNIKTGNIANILMYLDRIYKFKSNFFDNETIIDSFIKDKPVDEIIKEDILHQFDD